MRYGVADQTDRFLDIVRDLDVELFFESHDQLDQVEVSAEVVDEACALNHFIRFDVEVFDNDFLHAFKNVRHGYLSRYACIAARFRTLVLRLAHTLSNAKPLSQ